jgi:hypothetical protein
MGAGYWRAFGLQPRRLETFKPSTDPNFVAKVRNVIGLYISPPAHAIVLCVDEKSEIQALDRSQPVCRCVPASRQGATITKRTAPHRCSPPSIATGPVIGKRYGRHRAAKSRKFLDEIEAVVPG